MNVISNRKQALRFDVLSSSDNLKCLAAAPAGSVTPEALNTVYPSMPMALGPICVLLRVVGSLS